MSTEQDVRNASKEFYRALNQMATGDVASSSASMASAWSHSDAVTALHPIGGRDSGWNAVKDSFAQVASLASAGKITIENQQIQVDGDMAYEIGVEKGKFTMAGHEVPIDQRVTNVYRREGGSWKVVHHHTDLSPAMIDLLKTL